MLQFISLFFVSFGITFFFFTPDLTPIQTFKESWIWNKKGGYGTSAPKIGENPVKALNGYRWGASEYYSFSTGKSISILEPKRIEFPLFSKGYLEYEKIGDEVHFLSETGELYWTKPINSYPRAGYFAQPVLYLAGDNNSVFLFDQSGNPTGKGEINGRFLTDFCFDSNGGGALVVFSGGEIYRIDSKGNALYSLNLGSDSSHVFFKSGSLSPDGFVAGLHYSKDSQDFISLYGKDGEEISTIALPKVYSHNLYFSITNDERILINAPDKVYFFVRGNLQKQWEKKESQSIYQAVLALEKGLIFESEGILHFLDLDGNLVKQKSIPKSEKPIRLVPSRSKSQFYLETKEDLYQFTQF